MYSAIWNSVETEPGWKKLKMLFFMMKSSFDLCDDVAGTAEQVLGNLAVSGNGGALEQLEDGLFNFCSSLRYEVEVRLR